MNDKLMSKLSKNLTSISACTSLGAGMQALFAFFSSHIFQVFCLLGRAVVVVFVLTVQLASGAAVYYYNWQFNSKSTDGDSQLKIN